MVYPTTLTPTLTQPGIGTYEDDAGFEHDTQHTEVALDVEALKAKVGISGSAVTSSVDYILNHLAPSATVALPSILSPAQLTANQNNYNPGAAVIFRMTADSTPRNVTGWTAPTTNAVIAILNVGTAGTNPFVLKTMSGSSSAANQFNLNGDVSLTGGTGILLWYDLVSTCWRPLSLDGTTGDGAGHTIKENGTGLTARTGLNFVNGILATDNAGANETDINISYATTGDLANVAAVENAGSALTVAAGDHVHAHGTGYSPDAHHNEVHTFASHTDQTRYFWMMAEQINAVGPVALAAIGSTPNWIRAINIPDSATGAARFNFMVPDDYVSGLTASIVWTSDVGDATAAHTVRWALTGLRIAASGDNVIGAGQTDTFTGDNSASKAIDLAVFEAARPVSGWLSVTPVAGDYIRMVIQRIGADAADTVVGAINLIGIQFNYIGHQ